MDATDRTIVDHLRANARISATELAKLVHLSVSATGDRLRRLTSSGVIRRFTVEIDPAAVGRPIEALVDVRLPPDAEMRSLDERLLEFESVVNASHLTGSFDLQLRIAAADVSELDELLTGLKDELGAAETNTRLVLRTVDGFPRPPALGPGGP